MIGALIHIRDLDAPHKFFHRLRVDIKSLGVQLLAIVDNSQYQQAQYFKTTDFEIRRFSTLDEAEKSLEDWAMIYLEPARLTPNFQTIPLPEFIHPRDVIYVTGPDASGLPVKGREGRTWVYIPMPDDGVLYAETALCLALYDRLAKQWR